MKEYAHSVSSGFCVHLKNRFKDFVHPYLGETCPFLAVFVFCMDCTVIPSMILVDGPIRPVDLVVRWSKNGKNRFCLQGQRDASCLYHRQYNATRLRRERNEVTSVGHDKKASSRYFSEMLCLSFWDPRG